MNNWLKLLGGLVLAAQAFTGAWAQAYPSKTIKLIVGYPPGNQTGPDYLARIIADKMGKVLGREMIVENRPGAGGAIATAFVARQKPDGYTIILGETGQLEVAPAVHGAKIGYDPLKDLTPIGMITDAGGGVIVVNAKKLPNVHTIDDLIKEAKSRPGRIPFGSAGVGSIHHVIMGGFAKATGTQFLHVPFKGAAEIVPALLAGDIDVVPTAWQIVKPHADAGTLRILATTNDRTFSIDPTLPPLTKFINEKWLAFSGSPRFQCNK